MNTARTREMFLWMRKIIQSMWDFMHERWKERGRAAKTDVHNVRKDHLMAEVKNLMADERRMPVRYGFLLKPGVQALEKSLLSHIQYWVVKSGRIIRRW